MIGKRAGASRQPGVCWRSSSSATSSISTNSRSKILLATLAGMAAAGLYGPAASRSWVVENMGTDSSDPDGVIPASDNLVRSWESRAVWY